MEIPLTVQNLHDITPSSYVSISGAVLHPLSYQMAVGYSVPVVRSQPVAQAQVPHQH